MHNKNKNKSRQNILWPEHDKYRGGERNSRWWAPAGAWAPEGKTALWGMGQRKHTPKGSSLAATISNPAPAPWWEDRLIFLVGLLRSSSCQTKCKNMYKNMKELTKHFIKGDGLVGKSSCANLMTWVSDSQNPCKTGTQWHQSVILHVLWWDRRQRDRRISQKLSDQTA